MDFLLDLALLILKGAAVTMELTLLTTVAALPISLVVGALRLGKSRLVRLFAGIYVEIFRGTSLLVQIFFIFYVLPIYNVVLGPYESAVLALGLNFGAYGSEIVRAAIQSIDPGQREAGIALNMRPIFILRRVIMPQALVVMLPPFGNLLIEALKATSLVSVIGLTELTFTWKELSEMTARPDAVFSAVLVCYLLLALPLTRTVRLVEARISRGLQLGRAT
jgi:polar amino acid transport system permease protein